MITIRNVTTNDAKRIREIYEYYVNNTAITFDYDVPTVDDFIESITKISSVFPYIVLEEDGYIVGYSYANYFKPRKAYMHSCEVTIYLDNNYRKHGYGKMLYNELENKLKERDIFNLYAAIGKPIVEDKYLNNNSEEFHTHMGYKLAGRFNKCGYKFDTWYDLLWMEKILK